MKHIQDTPWWICDPEETNYCTYSDTDSIYMHAEPLLRFRHDNFFEGTWIRWDYQDERESERIDINYPIVGKGSMVYHFVEEGKSNWEKLSIDSLGQNEKIIYKKIK
jgi:hypothetical protein